MTTSQPSAPKKARFRAVVGVDLADGTRVEAGDLVPKDVDVPEWMVSTGKVEKE